MNESINDDDDDWNRNFKTRVLINLNMRASNFTLLNLNFKFSI